MLDLESTYTMWSITLVLAVVVLLVVAFLLERILRSVTQIEEVAGDIWTVGKNIANNTVHVPLLITTNRVVDEIYEHAVGVVTQAERIHQHAEGCPGCPDCVLDRAAAPGSGLLLDADGEASASEES